MQNLRVLVVDDAAVFRSQIKNAINQIDGVEVIGVAANGKIAIEKLQQTKIDLVTLDLEMPEMDGLQTIQEIHRRNINVKVIVFSSQSQQGANQTVRALSLGADDFVAKPTNTNSGTTGSDAILSQLKPRILQFLNRSIPTVPTSKAKVPTQTYLKKDLKLFKPKAIVIASSTGGPKALEDLFMSVSELHCPVFIAQHMPPMFTASLAGRLSRVCSMTVKEAEHDEIAKPGHVYIVPGDYHMTLVESEGQIKMSLNQGPLRNNVRPCADFLFESAAKVFGKSCLGVVLTGMGEDGKDGSMALKEVGGGVLIQHKDTCAVYGMPGSVEAVNAFDEIRTIQELNESFFRLSKGGFL